MIITTTAQIEGYRIRAYHGIVFGEVVSGVDFVKDFGAGLRNFFGGRSEGYEEAGRPDGGQRCRRCGYRL